MRRRAVSLLEVLFAIGVIAIGLGGVLALLPLGLYQMGKGNVADRSAIVGLNAVEDFEIFGMGRPDAWIYADGTPVQSATKVTTPPYLPVRYSFCIDPRFIATPDNQTGAGQPVVYTVSPYFDARFFPYYSWPAPSASSGLPSPPGAPPTTLFNSLYSTTIPPFTQNPAHPRMIRISLKQAAGAPLNIGPTALGATPYDLAARLSLPHANRLFVSSDDLAFEIPKDKALLPIQLFRGVRDFEGRSSWMATLVPRADAAGYSVDTFLLSIVVFHQRPFLAMFEDQDANGAYTPGEETDNERIVDVISFEGGGFAGGDVTLQGTSAAQLKLSEGDWIMLGGSAGVAAGSSEAPDFRWYRIVATDTEPENVGSGNFQRVVTLQGADWQRPEWLLANSDPSFRPTQATIVTGVVSVYEKIITLETTVDWPQ